MSYTRPWTAVTGATIYGQQLYRRVIGFGASMEEGSQTISVQYEEAIGADKVILNGHGGYVISGALFSAWVTGQSGETVEQGLAAALAQSNPQTYIDGVNAALEGG